MGSKNVATDGHVGEGTPTGDSAWDLRRDDARRTTPWYTPPAGASEPMEVAGEQPTVQRVTPNSVPH